MPICFWNDPGDEKYLDAYFRHYPGVWRHGDYVEITEHGGVIVYGRSDATLNPGGVRIGTAEIYRQVEALDEVVERLVVGQHWDNDVRVDPVRGPAGRGRKLDDALVEDASTTRSAPTPPRATCRPRSSPCPTSPAPSAASWWSWR